MLVTKRAWLCEYDYNYKRSGSNKNSEMVRRLEEGHLILPTVMIRRKQGVIHLFKSNTAYYNICEIIELFLL